MRELIRNTHKKWLEAKSYAARRCRYSNPEISRQLKECTIFSGEETIPELVELIFSPQGREFMLANRFPALPLFRKFKRFKPEKYKVFIDMGLIQISNPGECFLIGETEAHIVCDKTEKTNVILMHGAKAVIEGHGFSIIHVERDKSSRCDTFVYEDAKII